MVFVAGRSRSETQVGGWSGFGLSTRFHLSKKTSNRPPWNLCQVSQKKKYERISFIKRYMYSRVWGMFQGCVGDFFESLE